MQFNDCIIDVSHNNGPIDWDAVAGDGIQVAFIKAVEGSTFRDPLFGQYVLGAKKAGITVIPYDFLRPLYPVDVPTVVKFFTTVANLTQGSMFMLDWEGRANQTCTPAQAEAIGAALEKITGRTPIGYWGQPGSTPAQPTVAMTRWNRFIPRYPQIPQAASFDDMTPNSVAKMPAGALIWQYSSAAQVDGINGDVDCSVWCGDQASLDAWIKTGVLPTP